MNDHSDTDDNGDGEGVWSPDIEQCFREALLLFPPCGRRKHILQEEGGGKMYGRNELIARHIRMRTGKIRTRKQVSSHIQVLARRKAKADAVAGNGGVPTGSESPTSSLSGAIENVRMNSRPTSASSNSQQQHNGASGNRQNTYYGVWSDRPIVTHKIRLVEFSAFIEYQKNQLLAGQALQQTLNNQTSSSLTNLANAALVADLEQQVPMSQSQTLMIKQESQATSTMSNNDLDQHQLPLSIPVYLQQQNISTSQQVPVSAISMTTSNGYHQPLINSQQHQLHLNQQNQSDSGMTSMVLTSVASQTNVTNTATMHSGHLQQSLNHQQQQNAHNTSSGLIRHSYIKIDYRMPSNRQVNKLERIVLSQIQDKFPEIGGSDGLFQRGPSDVFFLVKFWADLNCDYEYNANDQNSYFGFSCHFETIEPYKDITCSTKACSYGLQVVEKVEKIYGAFNSSNGRYSYEINKSPMCEFMIQFIKKLRQLPRASQMNSVLENFTVLQEITCESTSEVLLCLAYVFEVASPDDLNIGSHYHVYKLTKD